MSKMARPITCALIAAGVAIAMAAAPASAAPARHRAHHTHLAGAAARPKNCPTDLSFCPSPDFLATVVSGVGTDMCLDVPNGTGNGSNVVISRCTGSTTQTWDFHTLGSSGAYQIKAGGGGSSMCLDDFGGSSANYSNVDIWQCNGHTSQEWLDTGSASSIFHVFGSSTGPCLDDYHSGTGNGNNVDIYQCNGTAAQSWTINAILDK